MRNVIRQWVIGIFYPYQCPFCRTIVGGGHPDLCASCRENIKKISEPRCKKCGRPIRVPEKEFCGDCEEKPHLYEEGMALYLYEGEVRKAVHRLKFQNQRVYGEIFGKAMAEAFEEKIKKWGVEAVIPVPMYKKKQRKRGYNQAELLAREVAQRLELPLLCDLVVRTRDTKPQKELTGKERENNLKKAFLMVDDAVKLRKILIVDDIYTTGSTVDAMADVLKRHGVEAVYFISLCIGQGEGDGCDDGRV
ncbi:MAG: ComF family protein [Lachnospiraceae bacterium]|nr:ComF family protein [Robinsoniella sp.]MDY3767613.1 ComF family protein [Lachnospiraceae bacterium]